MKCDHDPMDDAGRALGMYHCPECGEMVVAGMPHPDYDYDLTEVDHAIIEGRACWWPDRDGRDDPEGPNREEFLIGF